MKKQLMKEGELTLQTAGGLQNEASFILVYFASENLLQFIIVPGDGEEFVHSI